MTFQHWSVWFDAKLYLVQREDEAHVSKNLKKGKDVKNKGGRTTIISVISKMFLN